MWWWLVLQDEAVWFIIIAQSSLLLCFIGVGWPKNACILRRMGKSKVGYESRNGVEKDNIKLCNLAIFVRRGKTTDEKQKKSIAIFGLICINGIWEIEIKIAEKCILVFRSNINPLHKLSLNLNQSKSTDYQWNLTDQIAKKRLL